MSFSQTEVTIRRYIMEQRQSRENFSRKRTAILKTLQETDIHPTADWVYEQMRQRYPNLSLGTVYRNLKKLCETGKAGTIGVVNGQEHFDGYLEAHSHFICNHCCGIHDINAVFFSTQDFLTYSDTYNCEINDATVVFHGLCHDCAETANKAG